MTPEFSRIYDKRHLAAAPVELVASETEREALARRFGIIAVNRFEAKVDLIAQGDRVSASGKLSADLIQSCAITGDDLPTTVREAVNIVFVPEQDEPQGDTDMELTGNEPDEIPYSGTAFDLGDALAETLGLAIDPYATGPDADAAREKYGLNDEGPKGPLAEALAKLTKRD
jgi:uncharacterized metal-binding protein YceD (DUF177 family)